MKTRKYTNIRVSKRVNVSSTCHYSFSVQFDAKRPFHFSGALHYCPGDGFWTATGYPKFPQYVTDAVNQSVLERLKDPQTVYFERDRDGNERTENLRYHDPEYVANWARGFEMRLNSKEIAE
jgi:hypothetical protein